MMKGKINRLTEENLQKSVIIARLHEQLNPKKVVEEMEKNNAHVVVVKETMNRDPEEDAKFLELIKSIDEANAKEKKIVKKNAPKEAPRAEVVETKASKKKARKKKKKSPVKVELPTNGSIAEETNDNASTEDTFFMDALPEDEFKDLDSKEQEMLMKDLGSVQKEIQEILGREQIVFESEMKDAKPKKKLKKKKKKVSKKTVKKSSKAEAKPVAAGVQVDSANNPWGALKQSTLQRKTIAQLTEYLTERVS